MLKSRRKAGETAPTSGGNTRGTSPKPPGGRSARSRGVGHGDRDGSTRLSPPVILTIGCFILFGVIVLVSIISPTSKKQMLEMEKNVEDEVLKELFGGGEHEKVVPPIPQPDSPQEKSMDATEAMLKQDSSWVDGEKKLKKQLKILAERQAQGKDLGVPVLTRWLGDDIPAWGRGGSRCRRMEEKSRCEICRNERGRKFMESESCSIYGEVETMYIMSGRHEW